jgi:hypothetical protein|uniref:Sulfolobus virus coat protein C-terminal domain-containing protein n=1 Tax=candidate division WOR-3 bacterium TaxID=2052148 RepID=A0A7V3PTN2_UNCW3
MSNILKRLAKWTTKTNPERVKALLEELRNTMTANMQTVLPDLIAVESRVKQVLNENGIATAANPNYLAFARELWSLQRRQFAGNALTREVAILIQKWTSRGLTPAVLEQIRDQVFTVSTPAP